MTKVSADWLSSDSAIRICSAFESRGYQIYFVGGCVRNQLLGRDVTDLDLATDAEPQDMLELAAEEGLKAVPTGIEHGTITFVSHGKPYEITTFRNDVETDGRRAKVSFSKELIEDAKRRDFTMNALYVSSDGTLLDPVDGLRDLEAGLVRFIGDPDARIREDFLRILRFFRFFAWYADATKGIDADGLAACANNVDQLPSLSKERLTAELLRILGAPDPSMSVASMDAIGALSHILPGSTASALPVLVHLENRIGLEVDPVARLAALGGEPQSFLRLSKAQEKRLAAYGAHYDTAYETGYRLKDLGLHNLAVMASRAGIEIESKKAEMARIGSSATFPIAASDLMPKLSGKALGDHLKQLEQQWIESGFKLTKDQLLD